jgi:hypothetical protein
MGLLLESDCTTGVTCRAFPPAISADGYKVPALRLESIDSFRVSPLQGP